MSTRTETEASPTLASGYRTHSCGALRESDVGQQVVLSGWIHRLRDFGGMLFIDLRDRFGITQLVTQSRKDLRLECVIRATGTVVARKNPNLQIPTGKIEIAVDTIELLAYADVTPFLVADETMDVNEELRLKYRYLDMRKGPIINNLLLRHKAMLAARKSLDDEGFVEVTTPVLGKSTPEGARDYLVPSRLYAGSFYALPQSPQLYKQLLMVGGMDRYFQFATCFRDEDLRSDRQPEFMQLDLEMSFATPEELFPIVERLIAHICHSCIGLEVRSPFQRMSYADCIERYGTDKPDLRFGMELQRLDNLALESSCTIYHDVLKNGGVVKGFVVQGGAAYSRKDLDSFTQYVGEFGLKGLSWIKLQATGISSSIGKWLTESQQQQWIASMGMQEGDLALIVAAPNKQANQALDHLRRRVAKLRGMGSGGYAFAWVTDFPLFAWNDTSQEIESEHHPFTAPHAEDLHLLDSNPLAMRSSSYDLVLNGYELISGSQRIHDPALQERIFAALKISPEDCKERFGFFVEALRYGTPPHCGMALGFDRLMMILSGAESIKDVIAFPKTQRAQDLMTQAPAAVTQDQLNQLHLKI